MGKETPAVRSVVRHPVQHLLRIRMIVLLLLSVFVLVLFVIRVPLQNVAPFFIPLALSLLLFLFTLASARKVQLGVPVDQRTGFVLTQLVTDLVVLTLVIHLVGGVNSIGLPFLYFILIGMTSLLYGMAWGLGAAFLSSIAYGIMGYLEERGAAHLMLPPAWNPFPTVEVSADPGMILSANLFYAICFFLFALLTGDLSIGIVEERERYEQLQQRMIELERRATVGQLASGLIHELSNAVAVTLGFIQVMRRRRDLPESVAEGLERVEEEAQRCRRLLRDALNYTRPSTEDLTPVDLHYVIDRALEAAAVAERDRHPKIVRAYHDHPISVWGNPTQLQQLFLNLLLNAYQAVPEEGGEIRVETRREDGGVYVSIHDNGPGISPDLLPHIFDPFFTTKEQGTGLGLSIVQSLVQAHRGVLSVESQQGEGTIFTVYLPETPA